MQGTKIPESAARAREHPVLPQEDAPCVPSICDLPEDVLVELLSMLPAHDLICACRLVCTQWRYVVDLTTLWKRKCQREGFHTQSLDRSISDWKIFYMLCSLKRNLIKNPSAEGWFVFGDRWRIEELPGPLGREMPDPKVHKYFVTSFGLCLKSQLITLKNEGYWNELMDEKRPEIVIKDWYAARFDCGCRYEITVRLLSEDYIVLEEFHPEPVVIEQWSDAMWREVSHTFHNYPAGVRYIWFQHGGQDTQFWAGWYGIRVTNSSITIGPWTLL
uniref:F-box only protein 6-like n=1 Tax=Nothoprocta perdicaria TaxID=30464 RepID=A0A8C6ZCX1_NOTPE